MFLQENNLVLKSILFLMIIILIFVIINVCIYCFLLKKEQLQVKNTKENYYVSNSFFKFYNFYKQKIYSYFTSNTYIKNGYKITIYQPCIFVIDNVIDLSMCDKLKKLIDYNKINMEKPIMSKRQNVECYKFTIEDYLEYKNNYIYYKYINSVFKKISKNIFGEKYKMSGFTCRKIYGGTKLHQDGYQLCKINNDKYTIRKASVILMLNDDYSGGIFNFPDYNISLKLKKGSAILFPPYWTHKHEVSSVGKNNFRYTINTWLYETEKLNYNENLLN